MLFCQRQTWKAHLWLSQPPLRLSRRPEELRSLYKWPKQMEMLTGRRSQNARRVFGPTASRRRLHGRQMTINLHLPTHSIFFFYFYTLPTLRIHTRSPFVISGLDQMRTLTSKSRARDNFVRVYERLSHLVMGRKSHVPFP